MREQVHAASLANLFLIYLKKKKKRKKKDCKKIKFEANSGKTSIVKMAKEIEL